jgi:chitinase
VGEGEWKSYEDIVPLQPSPNIDVVSMGGRRTLSYNSIETIKQKTKFAIDSGAGGVMIWEVGQDCRVK